jgi:DNA repair exonuclease SbcCD nuclease subunit
VHELKPTVIYPGNLQGRHFNETGEKGAYVVEVDDKNTITPTFISLSEVVFLREEIMLTEDESLPSLSDKIEGLKGRCIEEFGSVLLRLTLKGNTPLYEELRDARQLNTFADTLNEGVNYQADFAFISRIENKTQPLINWEERKQGDDFVADLIRKYEAIQADDTAQQEIIQSILEEIDSSQVYQKLRKYDLNANFSLEALIDLAKTRSITALIADKRDH